MATLLKLGTTIINADYLVEAETQPNGNFRLTLAGQPGPLIVDSPDQISALQRFFKQGALDLERLDQQSLGLASQALSVQAEMASS